jgi:hypothetical protein
MKKNSCIKIIFYYFIVFYLFFISYLYLKIKIDVENIREGLELEYVLVGKDKSFRLKHNFINRQEYVYTMQQIEKRLNGVKK